MLVQLGTTPVQTIHPAAAGTLNQCYVMQTPTINPAAHVYTITAGQYTLHFSLPHITYIYPG